MNNIEDILRIGKVISIKGRAIDVLVDKTKNSSHLLYNGQILKNVSAGSYVKICKGFERIIGKIEGEYIIEDTNANRKTYKREQDKIKRILNVSLLGYLDNNTFKQGIKELPLIDNECYILTQSEFDKVHNFIKIINDVPDEPIDIACLSNEQGKRIKIGVNSLFASHIGIFGNTGSGKSYTLAGLYHKLFKKYGNKDGFINNAKFVIIDFNGEYVNEDAIEQAGVVDSIITSKNKNTICLSTGRSGSKKKINISKDAIYNAIFWSIVLQATEKTQAPFIDSAFRNQYIKDRINTVDGIRELIKRTLKVITTFISQNQEKNIVEIFFG